MKAKKNWLVAALGLALVAATVISAPTPADAATYVRDLTVGSTGADVVQLQTFLVARGQLVMPVGVPMGYFGPLTRAALARYQASVGIVPPAGYFGPITRANLNAMVTPVPNPGNNDNDDDDDSDNDHDLQGGEGDIREFDVLGNPGDEDVDEGDSEQVLGFEFEAEDSDLMVERLEVYASTTDVGTDRPWDVIESATLYRDDDEIASVDNLDDEDEWDEEDDDVYSFRFENIDEIVDEDDNAKFYIEFTAVDNIDSDDDPTEIEVYIPDDGLRVVDAEGIDIFEGDEDQSRTVTFGEAAGGDLELSSDSDDNEDRIVFVDEDNDTDGVEILRFTVESNSSENAIDELQVELNAIGTTTNLSQVISNLTIEVDGDELSSESVPNGSGAQTVTFEDLEDDFVIDEDDEVEVVIYADIVEQEGNFGEGYRFEASVDGSGIEAEDSNGDDVTVSDDVTGGEIALRVDGLTAEFDSASARETFTADDTGERDRGTYTIRFDVTAEGDDVYVAGADYTYSDTGAASASSDFDAVGGSYDEETNTWRVDSGNTATFELTVQLTATQETPVAQRVWITGIDWDTDDDASPDETYDFDLEDFRTSALFLGGI
jgi:peptidoglycan hydrolase-like protein with peptidoglycan-binding domain